MPMDNKYVVKDGVVCFHPELSRMASSQQLAIVCTPHDVQVASAALSEVTGESIEMSASASQFIDSLRSQSDIHQSTFDELSQVFTEYEIPIGLMNKLFNLKGYRLHFIVDDSGSMSSQTDV
jgi:hypothetical protein